MKTFQRELQFLTGGGRMAETIRAKNWETTPLGPIERWPQSLRTTVSLCLGSNFPISMAWGPGRVQIYNDGYWPICGAKHPSSMGQDFKECWFSAWPVIGEAFEKAQAGNTSFLENQRMFLDRNGYLEETFFTFSFSPIRDESGRVAGLFHPVTETTVRMLSERRTRTLQQFAALTAKAHTVDEACSTAMQVLGDCPLDLPFALLYLLDEDERSGCLAGTAGIESGLVASPDRIDLRDPSCIWPVMQVVATGDPCLLNDLPPQIPQPCGPYPERPSQAVILPVRRGGAKGLAGILIAGFSSRLPLDDAYRSFFEFIAIHLGTAMSNARSYEEEKRRAQALAELDRAKTAFFSNVSHEFRTPITLMLGPLEDMLSHAGGDLSVRRDELDLVYRNGLRLLRLVNTLLDFSRIEASRMDATFEPVELGALTTDLAGIFRSVVERAGLRFTVECPALSKPVYVDREMWEKVVLNLLSNAFKFTFEGEIRVVVCEAGDLAQLQISDTGTGIPADDLPRIFDRFHRVRNAPGRTHEGTGIGLSLMQELVKLHGGSVRVESTLGAGTTFTVSLPFGHAHLPAEKIHTAPRRTAAPARAAGLAEEAGRWLPPAPELLPWGGGETHTQSRILVADDNADMREYLSRLLSDRYDVRAVTNGREALQAIARQAPDLVVSDVMMPEMDGFELIAALRKNRTTAHFPVLLLSARAGEECRIEGLEAGADDYLGKPFSARELLARVRANLELSQLRRTLSRESEAQLRILSDSNVIGLTTWDREGRILWANDALLSLLGLDREAFAAGPLDWRTLIPPSSRKVVRQAVRQLRSTGAFEPIEIDACRKDGAHVPVLVGGALYAGGNGTSFVLDLTELRRRETALAESEQRLRVSEEKVLLTLSAAHMGIWDWNLANGELVWSDRCKALFGLAPGDLITYDIFLSRIHPDDRLRIDRAVQEALKRKSRYAMNMRVLWQDDALHWVSATGHGFYDEAGNAIRMVGVAQDVTEQIRAEDALRDSVEHLRLTQDALRESEENLRRLNGDLEVRVRERTTELQDANKELEAFAYSVSHDLRAPLRGIDGWSLALLEDCGTQLDDDGNRYLARVRSEAQRMGDLIDGLLQLSRIGRAEVQRDSVDLSELGERCVARLREAHPERALEFVIEPGLKARCDGRLLDIVMTNLLHNAVKFTVFRRIAHIEFGRVVQNGVPAFYVRDDGVGFDMAYADTLFGAFQRLHKAGDFPGTGIGLATVHRVIRRHGGRVWPAAQPDCGATFYFTLGTESQ